MSRCHSMVLALALAAVAAGCTSPPSAGATPGFADEAYSVGFALPQEEGKEKAERHGFGHTVLLYIPNRIFDILDIVRARVRVGPGIGFTVRATELLDLKLGTWQSVFVGLRGPRLEPIIPWPFGMDIYSGAGVSFAEAESEDYYGKGEFGVGVHLLLIGVDIGVDLWEVGDFVTGLVTIDISNDDL